MARLSYTGIMSLDGYVADAKGSFDWSMPDEEVHAFVNDLDRGIGTYLLGRRMYEVLEVWEHMDLTDEPDVIRDYADIWRAADKIVYSTTLESVASGRTTVERKFDPVAVRRLKAEAERDLSVGGPDLADSAIRMGLVDDYHLFMSPVVVGGGKRYLPADVHLELELMGERCFENGVIYLHYSDVRSASRGG
jgi:dihydrofolate reductase